MYSRQHLMRDESNDISPHTIISPVASHLPTYHHLTSCLTPALGARRITQQGDYILHLITGRKQQQAESDSELIPAVRGKSHGCQCIRQALIFNAEADCSAVPTINQYLGFYPFSFSKERKIPNPRPLTSSDLI